MVDLVFLAACGERSAEQILFASGGASRYWGGAGQSAAEEEEEGRKAKEWSGVIGVYVPVRSERQDGRLDMGLLCRDLHR